MREDITVARIAIEDARVEELDVEGLPGYAEYVLRHADVVWLEADAEMRQRIQVVLFQTG